MDLVISKEPEVQAIQRLLRAILRCFRVAGDGGVEPLVVSSVLQNKGLSEDKTSMLIDSLIERDMLANTGSQYFVTPRGHEFLEALDDAYTSGELPPAPPCVLH